MYKLPATREDHARARASIPRGASTSFTSGATIFFVRDYRFIIDEFESIFRGSVSTRTRADPYGSRVYSIYLVILFSSHISYQWFAVIRSLSRTC